MKFPAQFGLVFPLLLGGVLLPASPALAQHAVSLRAGLIYHVVGEVFLENRKLSAERNFAKPELVETGHTLRTEIGLVEVLLGPAIFLRLDEGGAIRLLDDRLTNARVLIERGSALVEVVDKPDDTQLWAQVGDATIRLEQSGLYRFQVEPATEGSLGRAELRVHRGEAWVSRDGAETPDHVSRGQTAQLHGDGEKGRFDMRNADAFHQWAAMRSFTVFMIDYQSAPGVRRPWYLRNVREFWNDSYEVAFPRNLLGPTRLDPFGLPTPPKMQ